MTKENYLSQALNWVKRKSVSSIKSHHEDHESPKIYTNAATQEQIQADFSFVSQGRRHYTDIALKSDTPQKLVTRWKLLSTMASLKSGKLFLLTPRGHKMFAQRLVDRYKIKAVIHSL